MACGTGKTLVGPFLAERLGATQVLVLVPSLSLLGQTLREWATATDFDYLAVCSDDTVTKDEQDAVVASTSELGIPVTTDPERIASFLRRPSEETRVVFATYQSSPRIAAAQGDLVPAFDLVICDEAHRCAGPQAGVFATVLDATKIRAHKRLFMTATPRYYTGRVKREAKEADWEVASMDEELKFGSVLHRLTFAQAIDQELLSDYQVVVVGVSDDEAQDLAERAAFVTRDETTVTDARTLSRQIGLLRVMAKHDLHRVVSFHSRIDHASRFAASLTETNEWLPADLRLTGLLWTDHVSGKMTAGERDARLRRLKAVEGDERGLLTNARCLAEGVDVPTLDGVAFIDPRRSQVDVVQAVGRAIRLAEGKTLGTIVIPVLIEEEGDPEEALASSEFDRVWQIVRALRDHDEVLADELDELRRGQARRGSLGVRPRKIVFELPVRIGDAFARAFDTVLVETSTPRWEFWFGLLERFIAREGHAQVGKRHREDGYPLGAWITRQRMIFRAGELSGKRIASLEALPGWKWEPFDEAWEEGFSYLERYVAREGHARVPHSQREDGQALGAWVHAQRVSFKAGRPSAERIAQLEALPDWTWDVKEAAWDEGFSYLERFIAREGHTLVRLDHREDDYALGSWVNRQRRFYGAGQLSRERFAVLEALPGWTWNRAFDAAWEEGFSHLERFIAREGHAHIPWEHLEEGFALGKWVSRQRRYHGAGAPRLSAERIARLEALSGWTWGVEEDAWEEGVSYLEQFVAREGHARVLQHHREDGYALGSWVSRQRKSWRTGRLSGARTARLEALPEWTWDATKKT